MSSGDSAAGGQPAEREAEITEADRLVARQERLPWNAFYYRAFPMLGLGTFYDAFDANVIGGVGAILLSQFHLTLLQEGGLISATYGGQFFGAWIFGWMAEKYGRKVTYEACMLLFGGLSLVCAIAPDYNTLFWARVIQGFGLGGEVPVAGALLNELVGRRRRGFLVNFYENWFFGIGITLASTVLALLNVEFGTLLSWRILFAIGFTPAPWVILCYFILPESPRWLIDHEKFDKADKLISGAEQRYAKKGLTLPEPVMRASVHADIKKTKVWELFSKDYRMRTLLTFSLWFGAYYPGYGFTLFQPTIYVEIGHITLNQALLIATTASAFTAFGLPYAAWTAYLYDKLGRRFLMIYGFGMQTVMYTAAYVFFEFFHVTGWWYIYIFGALTFNSAAAGLYVYNPELYPTRMRALATAAGSSMNRFASTIAPLINAILLGGATSATTMTVAGLGNVYLLISGVSLYTFLIAWRFAPETSGRQLEELSH